MNVSIVGSRDYPDLNEVRDFVRKLARKYPDAVVVSGGARGVDRAAELAAYRAGLRVVSYRVVEDKADRGVFRVYRFDTSQPHPVHISSTVIHSVYESFGRAAYARNRLIVEDGDQVVVFWDGESPGTANDIEIAEKNCKPLHIFGQLAAEATAA